MEIYIRADLANIRRHIRLSNYRSVVVRVRLIGWLIILYLVYRSNHLVRSLLAHMRFIFPALFILSVNGAALDPDAEGCELEAVREGMEPRFVICPHEIHLRPAPGEECLNLDLLVPQKAIDVKREIPRMTDWFNLAVYLPCIVHKGEQAASFSFVRETTSQQVQCLSPSGKVFAQYMVSQETIRGGHIQPRCDAVYKFIIGDRYLRSLIGL